MWHQLPYDAKRPPAGSDPDVAGAVPRQERITVPAGRAALGSRRHDTPFGWDNEFPAVTAAVAAFVMDRFNVTNQDYLEFVEAGGYRDPRWWTPEGWAWLEAEAVAHPHFWRRDDGGWLWRGMFAEVRLPMAWPVYVSQCEAAAYARWQGRRLPTEAEFHRAAYGGPEGGERPFPWGDALPDSARGHFDFGGWGDPQPVGRHPTGRSAWGHDDLVGNGWEWTTSVFEPFPGFVALPSYPEYSADFFDGQHYVMKGASPVTARELLRPGFRNWFRPQYPYVYAAFRCALEAGR
jgi:ergothioneine biosynthesis protein EgtB